jgi:hypothetical protein
VKASMQKNTAKYKVQIQNHECIVMQNPLGKKSITANLLLIHN